MTEQRPEQSDRFRASTMFGILAAIVVIVVSASAAGQHLFDGYADTGSGNPAATSVDGPPAEDGTHETTVPEEHAPSPAAETASLDDTADVLRDAAADGLKRTADDLTDRMAEKAVATLARHATDTVQDALPSAQAEQLAADAENAAENRGLSMLFSAIGDLWSTLFTKAWPFMKGFGTGLWNALERHSYYVPEEA